MSLLDAPRYKLAATVIVGMAALLACAGLAQRAVTYQRGVRGASLFAEGDPLTAYPYLVAAARARGVGGLNGAPLRDLGEVSTWALDDTRFLTRHAELSPALAARLAFGSYAQSLIRRPASSYAMAGLADLVRRVAQVLPDTFGGNEPVPLSDVASPRGAGRAPAERLVEAAYRRAIDMEPSNYFWYAYLADYFVERGRRAEALPLYTHAIRLMPDLGWHYYLGSGGPLPDDMFQAVVAGLEEARRETPAIPPEKIEASLGSVYDRQKDYESALTHYRRAVEVAPDPSRYLFMAASTLSSMGRLDEARETYQRALAAGGLNRRQQVTAYSVIGRLLLRQGRAREAVETLQKARVLDPGSYGTRVDLGQALEQSGEPEQAEAEYAQAIALDPTTPRAYEHLIRLYRGRRELARAIPLARRLVELHPDDAGARAQLEALYREMNDPAP